MHHLVLDLTDVPARQLRHGGVCRIDPLFTVTFAEGEHLEKRSAPLTKFLLRTPLSAVRPGQSPVVENEGREREDAERDESERHPHVRSLFRRAWPVVTHQPKKYTPPPEGMKGGFPQNNLSN